MTAQPHDASGITRLVPILPAGVLLSTDADATVLMFTRVTGLTAACLLVMAVVPLTAQEGRLSGVAGIPVEGHEVIGAFQVRGSERLDVKRLLARLPEEGVLLRLGRPLDPASICRIRESIRDQMADQGFHEAVVAHELLPFPPGRAHNAVRLVFTITEGSRASRTEWRAPALRPAQRCEG